LTNAIKQHTFENKHKKIQLEISKSKINGNLARFTLRLKVEHRIK